MSTVLLQICDICSNAGERSEATTQRVGLDGIFHEGDCCGHHAEQLQKKLAPFLAVLSPDRDVAPSVNSHRPLTPVTIKGRAADRQCPKCKGMFAVQGLLMHERSCLGPMPPDGWMCGVGGCQKRYKLANQVHRHRFEQHGVQDPAMPFRCPECGRGFVYDQRMQSHRRDQHGMEIPA